MAAQIQNNIRILAPMTQIITKNIKENPMYNRFGNRPATKNLIDNMTPNFFSNPKT